MGLDRLRNRFNDPSYGESFAGLFPRDNPKNTRFAINFFTSIGLGGLTYVLMRRVRCCERSDIFESCLFVACFAVMTCARG